MLLYAQVDSLAVKFLSALGFNRVGIRNWACDTLTSTDLSVTDNYNNPSNVFFAIFQVFIHVNFHIFISDRLVHLYITTIG